MVSLLRRVLRRTRSLAQDCTATLARGLAAVGWLALRRFGLTPLPTGLNLLYVDDMYPDPTFGAGYPRAAEIIKQLVHDGWHVTMYPLDGTRAQARLVSAVFPSVRFIAGRGTGGLSHLLKTRGTAFEAVIVSRPEPMKAFAKAAPRDLRARIIYDAEALIAPRNALRRQLLGSPWTQEQFNRAVADEIALTHSASAVIAVPAAMLRCFATLSEFLSVSPLITLLCPCPSPALRSAVIYCSWGA